MAVFFHIMQDYTSSFELPAATPWGVEGSSTQLTPIPSPRHDDDAPLRVATNTCRRDGKKFSRRGFKWDWKGDLMGFNGIIWDDMGWILGGFQLGKWGYPLIAGWWKFHGLDTELDDDWGVPHDSGNIHISWLWIIQFSLARRLFRFMK